MSSPRFFVWRVTALVHLPGETNKKRLVVTLVDSVPTLLTRTQVLSQGLDVLLENEDSAETRAQITASVQVEQVPVGEKCVYLFQ
jgi:hypothetical protein